MFFALYLKPNSLDDWSTVEGSPFKDNTLSIGDLGYVMCSTGKYGFDSNYVAAPSKLYRIDQLRKDISLLSENLSAALDGDISVDVDGGLAKSSDVVFDLENVTNFVDSSLLIGREVFLQVGTTSDYPLNETDGIVFKGRVFKVTPKRKVLSLVCRGFLQRVKDKILGEVKNSGEDSVYKSEVAPLSYGLLNDPSSFAPLLLEREGATFKFKANDAKSVSNLVLYDDKNDITFPLASDFEIDEEGYISIKESETTSFYAIGGVSSEGSYPQGIILTEQNRIDVWCPPTVAFSLDLTTLADPSEIHNLVAHSKFQQGTVYSVDGNSYEYVEYKDGYYIFTVAGEDNLPTESSGVLTKVSGDGPNSLDYDWHSAMIYPKIHTEKESYVWRWDDQKADYVMPKGYAGSKTDPIVLKVNEEKFFVLDTAFVFNNDNRYVSTLCNVLRAYRNTVRAEHSCPADLSLEGEVSLFGRFKHEVYPSMLNNVRSVEVEVDTGTYDPYEEISLNPDKLSFAKNDSFIKSKVENLFLMYNKGWTSEANEIKFVDSYGDLSDLPLESDDFIFTVPLGDDPTKLLFLFELTFPAINIESRVTEVYALGCYSSRLTQPYTFNKAENAYIHCGIGWVCGGSTVASPLMQSPKDRGGIVTGIVTQWSQSGVGFQDSDPLQWTWAGGFINYNFVGNFIKDPSPWWPPSEIVDGPSDFTKLDAIQKAFRTWEDRLPASFLSALYVGISTSEVNQRYFRFNNSVKRFKSFEYNPSLLEYYGGSPGEGGNWFNAIPFYSDKKIFTFMDTERASVSKFHDTLDISSLSDFENKRICLAFDIFNNYKFETHHGSTANIEFRVAAPGFLVYFETDITKTRLWWKGEGKVDNTGDLIENPVDIIYDLLVNVLGVDASRIVGDSFDSCKARRPGWKFSFSLYESAQRSAEFLDKILRQAGLVLSETGEGKLYLSDMLPPDITANPKAISKVILDSDDLADWQEEYTGINRIATKFVVRHSKNSIKDSYLKSFETEDTEALKVLDEERKVYLDLDLVKDEYTATEIANIKKMYNRSSIRKLTLRCPLDYLDYEVGDWVIIDDPYVNNTSGKVYKITQNNLKPDISGDKSYLEIKCFESDFYDILLLRITENSDSIRTTEDDASIMIV